MKPLKWQEDDPALAQEVWEKGKNYSPWWDTVMTLLDTVIFLFHR